MSSRDDRRDDDLEERLDELEDVLSELRRDLRETERDRRGPPRPPRLSELVRFTEQYTIPTVIALLETTIKSLELVQGTLRLADPGRGLDEGGLATDRLGDVRDGASAGLSRSLSELRTALSEADLPEEAASRSIIEDARDLTAEIEARIEEGRREADAARRGRRDRDGRNEVTPADEVSDDRDDRDDRNDHGDRGVRIDVTDPNPDDDDGSGGTDGDDDPAPEVDVESELESIKRRLDDERRAESAADTDAEGVSGGAEGGESDGDTDEDADNGGGAEGDESGE
ncbi:hypothetical protein CK500_13110 [Halorubrum salipaludis]|uniref:Uncharacterized protein n=1 Tax=Halorubrum salipaludis TaxID=2032630 RepID=A0A2A2FDA5_9EURY|nr:hypothetical protein [Halorubrum salipaludis]PAU82533.1 hypothetical protein CK500_13110 [Halorubrum salipaludis]